MRTLWLLGLVACAHAAPREVLGGQKMALGVLTGDPEAVQLVRDALALELVFSEGSQPMRLDVHVVTGAHDEPAHPAGLDAMPPSGRPEPLYRRVQHMVATLTVVDASGAVLVEGTYEDEERGAERPRDARPSDDLGVILARRIVRRFLTEHGY